MKKRGKGACWHTSAHVPVLYGLYFTIPSMQFTTCSMQLTMYPVELLKIFRYTAFNKRNKQNQKKAGRKIKFRRNYNAGNYQGLSSDQTI